MNAIAAISSVGVLATELTTGKVNGERFFDFARGCLLPKMLPYDGVNPRSIIIMDNCAIHHVDAVRELLQQVSILVLFLPPYSPDRNPIEETFSYIKHYLRRHDELLQCLQDPTCIIEEAFKSITAEHCNGWITHAGYY